MKVNNENTKVNNIVMKVRHDLDVRIRGCEFKSDHPS